MPGFESGCSTIAETMTTVQRKYNPEGGKEMQNVMSKILKAARDESGAEMVEWIVVVAILATVAVLVFGPNGFLAGAMNNGINTIGGIITNAS
jgi:Flp pilus assembly pilin Flp